MGVALSPYRVLGERPPAEALRALPVVEVRPPLVLSANATFDDEDFAVVRYVEEYEHEVPRNAEPLPTSEAGVSRHLVVMLVLGFAVACAVIAVCEIVHRFG